MLQASSSKLQPQRLSLIIILECYVHCMPMLSLLLVFVAIGALWLFRRRRSGISRDGRRLPYEFSVPPMLRGGDINDTLGWTENRRTPYLFSATVYSSCKPDTSCSAGSPNASVASVSRPLRSPSLPYLLVSSSTIPRIWSLC